MNLWQLLECALQILNVLLLGRMFLVCGTNGRIKLAEFLPPFIRAQWRIKFQSPEFDSTCENRSIILAQGIIRNVLFGGNRIEGFPKMMNSWKWNIIDPSLTSLCVIASVSSTTICPIKRYSH